MRISRIRRNLYRGARILGDGQAIARGPRATSRRIVRKGVYQTVFRAIRRTGL